MVFLLRHGFFLFCFAQAFVLRASHLPTIAWEDTGGVENLIGKVLWWTDGKARLSPDEVWAMEASHFRPFEEIKSAMPRGAALWGKFQIGAAGPGDTTLRYLFRPGSAEARRTPPGQAEK